MSDESIHLADPVASSIAAYSPFASEYARYNELRLDASWRRFTAGLPAGATVLDAGCGPGRDVARFVEGGFAVVGVDLNPDFLRMAAAAGPVLSADLRNLPFPDRSFDAVWASASLVHLPTVDAIRAMDELRRVARPGARVYLSVRTEGDTGWFDIQHGRRWFRVWNTDELVAAAASVGLVVECTTPYRQFVELWAQAAPRATAEQGHHTFNGSPVGGPPLRRATACR
jgi:SAM-dependent methyltransferase